MGTDPQAGRRRDDRLGRPAAPRGRPRHLPLLPAVRPLPTLPPPELQVLPDAAVELVGRRARCGRTSRAATASTSTSARTTPSSGSPTRSRTGWPPASTAPSRRSTRGARDRGLQGRRGRVAIQGAGGLGVYACAVAREMGAARIIVIDGVEERLALAKDFGADEIVDMRECPTPAARIERVLELTERLGRRRGHGAGRQPERRRRGAPDDGARGRLPRGRQHQRRLGGALRPVVDPLRQPADHRRRPLRGRASQGRRSTS